MMDCAQISFMHLKHHRIIPTLIKKRRFIMQRYLKGELEQNKV